MKMKTTKALSFTERFRALWNAVLIQVQSHFLTFQKLEKKTTLTRPYHARVNWSAPYEAARHKMIFSRFYPKCQNRARRLRIMTMIMQTIIQMRSMFLFRHDFEKFEKNLKFQFFETILKINKKRPWCSLHQKHFHTLSPPCISIIWCWSDLLVMKAWVKNLFLNY